MRSTAWSPWFSRPRVSPATFVGVGTRAAGGWREPRQNKAADVSAWNSAANNTRVARRNGGDKSSNNPLHHQALLQTVGNIIRSTKYKVAEKLLIFYSTTTLLAGTKPKYRRVEGRTPARQRSRLHPFVPAEGRLCCSTTRQPRPRQILWPPC